MSPDYTLTKAEKETVILYNQTPERVGISGYDPKLFRKLAEFAEKYPDKCRRTDKRKYPDYHEFTLEKSCLSIRLLPPMSEEKKAAARARAKASGLGGKQD